MSTSFDTRSIQTGDEVKRVESAPGCYRTRKDVLIIKEKLLSLVHDPEYWPTLSQFINGTCDKVRYNAIMSNLLKTNEMRFLHNQLIRSIIFNAYFSRCPPPGVEIPNNRGKIPTSTYQRAEAKALISDRRLIPSAERIWINMKNALKEDNLMIDGTAAIAVCNGLKKYIILILQAAADISSRANTIITAETIQYVCKYNCL